MAYEYEIKDLEILKVEGVSLKYGDKTILRDIDLTIKDVVRKNTTLATGQIVGFLGPSGRGKTQLFKILAGLNKPTTGTVLVHGKPVKYGDIGVVAQNYPLMMHRTVQGNLELGAGIGMLDSTIHFVLSKLSPKVLDKYSVLKRKKERYESKTAKIQTYLTKFKLADKADMYPASLSGGQRQRIAIIQQLLCSENFLLLDEPFSGLDINMIKEVSEVILEIANMDEFNTIVIVSHDITNTVAISNYLWILGYEHDKDGNAIEGAKIRYIEDLMAAGISWNYPDVYQMPKFQETVLSIKKEFKNL